MEKDVQDVKSNWFQKHLNLTLIIAWVGGLVFLFLPSVGFWPTPTILIVLLVSGWVLNEKGRSLGHLLWLLFPLFGIVPFVVFLVLENQRWRGGKLPGDTPDWAHSYLVTKLNVTPDYLNELRCVEHWAHANLDFTVKGDPNHLAELKSIGQWEHRGEVLLHHIRIFNPKEPEAYQIKNFISLNNHPELILYEGYRVEKSGEVIIAARAAASEGNGPSAV